jgi:hypothetical protein
MFKIYLINCFSTISIVIVCITWRMKRIQHIWHELFHVSIKYWILWAMWLPATQYWMTTQCLQVKGQVWSTVEESNNVNTHNKDILLNDTEESHKLLLARSKQELIRHVKHNNHYNKLLFQRCVCFIISWRIIFESSKFKVPRWPKTCLKAFCS